MSLYGPIKITNTNGTSSQVAFWDALKKEGVGGDFHRYQCYVEHKGLDGETRVAEFSVVHSYSEGALALAAAVLTEAHKQINLGTR